VMDEWIPDEPATIIEVVGDVERAISAFAGSSMSWGWGVDGVSAGVDMSSNEDWEAIALSANWSASGTMGALHIAYLSDRNR
jgi:hypothetical protein